MPSKARLLGSSVFTRSSVFAACTKPKPATSVPVAFAEPIDTSTPFLPTQVYDAFDARFRELIGRWLEKARQFAAIATYDALPIGMLQLHAEAELEPLALAMRDAHVLAALTGRASVIDEAAALGVSFADDADARGIEFQGGPYEEAIAFLRQKVALPQNEWQELLHHGHDRGFVVAGITSAEVAEDIHQLVLRHAPTLDIEEFRTDLDALIADGKWTGNPDMVIDGSEDADEFARKKRYRAWRTKTIFETNLSTAHAAARYKQQRALKDVLPYLEYVHAATRTPKRPRHHHVALDGLTLPQDDPTWKRIYAPNGWKCSCAVMAVTAAIYNRKDPSLKRAPSEAEIQMAVSPEWQYRPGDTWERGLVPEAERGRLDLKTPGQRPEELIPLDELSVPFGEITPPPQGAGKRQLVDYFLARFGGAIDRPVLYRDAGGQQIVISRELFRDRKTGGFKVNKGTRAHYLGQLAETIKDPDEIWVDAQHMRDGSVRVVRRYVRHDAETNTLVAFTHSRKGWRGLTAHTRNGNADKAAEELRTGALLYRRDLE